MTEFENEKITALIIVLFLTGMMTCLADAATIGYIEVQKFSSYEKQKSTGADGQEREGNSV